MSMKTSKQTTAAAPTAAADVAGKLSRVPTPEQEEHLTRKSNILLFRHWATLPLLHTQALVQCQ